MGEALGQRASARKRRRSADDPDWERLELMAFADEAPLNTRTLRIAELKKQGATLCVRNYMYNGDSKGRGRAVFGFNCIAMQSHRHSGQDMGVKGLFLEYV